MLSNRIYKEFIDDVLFIITFIEVKDLIDKFKFLENTDLFLEYEELNSYILHNY